MNISIKTKTFFAIAWAVFALLLTIILLWPVYSNNIKFGFYFNNILFVLSFMFFIRYIFFLNHSFIQNKIIIKVLLMPIAIFFAIYSYYALNEFIDFYQENGKYINLQHLPLKEQYFLADYVFGEYIFVGVAAILSSIILPFKLLISIWRVYNKGHE